MSLASRWTLIGAASAGTVGAIVGLVVGLNVYAATAWFAAIEVGFPAALAGGLLGFVASLIATGWHRFKQDS